MKETLYQYCKRWLQNCGLVSDKNDAYEEAIKIYSKAYGMTKIETVKFILYINEELK